MKLVLAGLLLTAPIVHGACYTSTYDIFQDITNNNVKVVEICPGTQFDIGFPVDKNFVEFAGGFPLIITGDDITVKCGSNGLSSNNCVFNGGFVQLLTGSIFGDTSSTSNNLKVQGLTFRGGGGLDSVFEEEWDARPIVTGNEGIGIVFDDCIFEDMNTGYVFDLTQASEGTVTVEITDSVFRNIQHRFSLINALTQTVTLNKVAFENVEHVEPGQVDVCKDKAEGACEYSSSVIAADSASLIDVTMTDVNYYTSLLLTKELLTLPGEPLITTNNIEIFDEGNRTINEDYCKGGYAAEADATGLEFKCFRLTSDVSVFDFIECGEDCREDGKYSEFIKILNATKLEEMLADEGDITLFIPTNDAINGLPNGLLDNLLEEEGLDTLTALVKYHVITKNVVDSAAIKLGYPASETFLQGEFVKYAFQDGIVYVNDAKVVEADWEEKPGTNTGSIVHSINKFLAPDSIPIYPSIGELVALTPTFSSLDAAMTSIGYARDLTLNKTYSKFIFLSCKWTHSFTFKFLSLFLCFQY